MRIFRSIGLLSTLVCGVGLIALPATSRADSLTYVQTSDDCTGGCGTSSGNTVTVSTTGTTGQLEISVSLASGFNFISSGFPGSFGFGLTGITSLTYIQGTTTWSVTGWTPIVTQTNPATAPSATNPQTHAGQSLSWDGAGTFSNGYGMQWNLGNGIGSQDGTTLDFFISGTGLTLASFAADSTGSFFVADVAGTGTTNGVRNTGIIDFTLAPVPLPPAALLFGSALIGLGVLGRRRRKVATA